MNKQVQISEGAKYLLQEINQVGEGYLVGGVVRDFLLGKKAHDEDICSSLLPEEVAKLFEHLPLIKAGLKHGTLGVHLGGSNYEITTYRVDGEYSDNRRPDKVEYTRSLREDLARRDFTINAMAMSAKGEIIDYFEGQKDLRAGLVRAVGDPYKRFTEDALRLLRAVRFANRLNFTIEEETEQAIRDKAALLQNISAERIADEFLKILLDNPQGVTRLHELGLLQYCYPELDACFNCPQENRFHLYDVGRHSVATAEAHPDLIFRVAAILHDVGKPPSKTYGADGVAHFYGHAELSAQISKEILRKLFLPKKERQLIVSVVRWHDFLSKKPAKLARLLREEGPEFFALLFRLKRADIMAQSDYQRERKLRLVDLQEEIFQRQVQGPYRLADLAINGKDLLDLGYCGAEIAEGLAETLAFVMEKPKRNQRDYLLARAERLKSEAK